MFPANSPAMSPAKSVLCYNSKIYFLLQSLCSFAIIVYFFCYQVFGEVSGQVSGETVYFLCFRDQPFFFCYIEAKAGSNAVKSGGSEAKAGFGGVFGHVSR